MWGQLIVLGNFCRFCYFYRAFFTDIADGLVGVGLITQSEDMPGMLSLDKGHNDMSKFLNRILGMKVEKQNLLFKYFSDTLNAIISQAKRAGKYDQVRIGVADNLGLCYCLVPTVNCKM